MQAKIHTLTVETDFTLIVTNTEKPILLKHLNAYLKGMGIV